VTLGSEFLAWLARQAGNHLWQSTAFAAAAFPLALALKATDARVRHWVWLGASIKFLLPFALLAVWLAGVAAVLLLWWSRWRRIRTVVHASLVLREGREADALRRLRSKWRLNLPDVELVSSAAKLEPGIFGIFRPVLWLPAGIADRLSETELDAVLAHELCHARRRDNLAAVVHMVAEAVFWFHPLVWCLGARLVEERERACDEQAVLLSGDPQAYTEGILKVCEFYVASPLTCAAGVTGADLRKRIEGIMEGRFMSQLCFWKKLLLTMLLAAAVAGPFLSGVFKAEAQTTAPSSGFGQPARKLEFEVASVKPTAVDHIGFVSGQARVGIRIYGDRAEYIYMTLRALIADAYQVRSWQVVGPDWLVTERFDVVCKIPAGSRKEDTHLMLQSLLAERFKLAVHRERKEQAVMALVVDLGGSKLKESPPEAPPNASDSKGEPPGLAGQAAPKKKDSSFSGTFGTSSVRFMLDSANSSVHIEYSRLTMPYFADLLGRTTLGNGHEVVDMTGLKGEYDVALDLPMAAFGIVSTTDAGIPDANAQEPRPAEAASDPGGGRKLESLKRLGLELVSRKAPVEQLIVDHAEKRPTEN